MPRYRIMGKGETPENGVVANIIIAPPDVAEKNGWALCDDDCGIGREFRDGAMLPLPAASLDLAALRLERNARLRASDWTQLPDVALDDIAKAAWADYRQTLRDLPGTLAAGATTVDWPEAPQGSR